MGGRISFSSLLLRSARVSSYRDDEMGLFYCASFLIFLLHWPGAFFRASQRPFPVFHFLSSLRRWSVYFFSLLWISISLLRKNFHFENRGWKASSNGRLEAFWPTYFVSFGRKDVERRNIEKAKLRPMQLYGVLHLWTWKKWLRGGLIKFPSSPQTRLTFENFQTARHFPLVCLNKTKMAARVFSRLQRGDQDAPHLFHF